MSYEITTMPEFDKAIKKLAKHYSSIKSDYRQLIESLKANPFQGSDLGGGIRKIRMAIASKGKGKSGGARVITYNVIISETNGEVRLLTIYDKSERETMTDKEIKELMKRCGLI